MTRPFLLGLTGSIGMGKTTTAQMFKDEGIPVWDADNVVHRLYGAGGRAVAPIGKLCPSVVVANAVDRTQLKAWIARDAGALKKIEQIVHPLVAADRQAFIERAAAKGADLIVLDVPLLFETGAEKYMDKTLVVSVAPDIQRERVLTRAGMTETQMNMLLARQMPDAEKRVCADYLIETRTLEETRMAVQNLIKEIRKEHA